MQNVSVSMIYGNMYNVLFFLSFFLLMNVNPLQFNLNTSLFDLISRKFLIRYQIIRLIWFAADILLYLYWYIVGGTSCFEHGYFSLKHKITFRKEKDNFSHGKYSMNTIAILQRTMKSNWIFHIKWAICFCTVFCYFKL